MKKKVLVTGSDGFIGSHLVEELMECGYDVRAFVYYNSFGSRGWLEELPEEKLSRIEVIHGDVRDNSMVDKAVKGVDIVFHLAALIGIPYSYRAPESYIDTNVKGTLNVLQAAGKFSVERVLITSTSEVYGTALYVPIDEKHPRQGQSPYSASKIGADFLSESFYRSFKLPLTVVRPFNTYGPRQSARAVIPTIIIQALRGVKKIKLGSLHPTRDFVFVKDTVKGFVKIAETDSLNGEEVNIATNSEISIKDLSDKLFSLIGADAEIISDSERTRPENSEVDRLLGSNEKLMKNTNWKPEYDLDRGLKETIEWFSDGSNLARYKHDIFNL